MTKGMVAMLVCTTKDCNYNSVVIVHQHGGYDVRQIDRQTNRQTDTYRQTDIHTYIHMIKR